jgi:2-methylisocitrate lyase-like PEP mutase family enzyme
MREEATMTTQAEKGARFRALHERAGVFVMPNPWDPGSARMLTALGFEALATTSAGFAHSIGRPDGGVTLQEKIDHCRQLCAATDLPLSADLENCYAEDPRTAAENLVAVAASGIVGGSIEDYSGDPANPIYDFNLAVERVHAAAEAVHALPYPFVLTARAENLLRGRNDMDDTLRRLQAFAAAGADVVYAPGLTSLEQVRLVTAAVDKPVNVLAPQVRSATVAALGEAGARRLSTGGALARAAITTFLRAARELHGEGTFGWTAGLAPLAEVEGLLG